MKTFYFSFLTHHKHPETGEDMARFVIEVEASDQTKARDAMFGAYSDKWGFMSEELPKISDVRIYETIVVAPGAIVRKEHKPPLSPNDGETPENPPTVGDVRKERLIEICEQVAEDVAEDAKNFDGQPLNGRVVAKYLEYHGAAIKALADVTKEILKELD